MKVPAARYLPTASNLACLPMDEVVTPSRYLVVPPPSATAFSVAPLSSHGEDSLASSPSERVDIGGHADVPERASCSYQILR